MIYLLLGCLLVIVSLLGRLFYLSKKLRQLPTNPSQTLVKHDPFLLHLSHQLRTALNGIVGTSTLLDNGSLSADQREKILIIRRSTISLMHIVDQLHDHLSGKDHTQTPKTSGQVTHDQTAISQFSR